MINKRKNHRVIICSALVLGGFLLGSVNYGMLKLMINSGVLGNVSEIMTVKKVSHDDPFESESSRRMAGQ
ncbi:hypothetical protein FML45_14065 [Klebsiella variicola]|uniref:Uncharacterized protein n=1 Tax=Klebsiella pasteurii TaxID=2587529 RepID=A0ABT5CVS3_9ENTR|nr:MULTISPECIES: hypothetical protein [Enterobacteriaceae]ELS5403225.1 hypothetical protein [Raoultella ornithinolytica]HBX3727724.1 hypothetical protein [Klebsiella pneumoniae subsp. pneumoniae]ASG37053.1 hypothetical protein CES89_26970 [Klebsiella pneumoniae]EEQ4609960.1 hypothetical protein [Escherichia coli]EJZ0015863.1 hypothetical protein [Escherichia coli]